MNLFSYSMGRLIGIWTHVFPGTSDYSAVRALRMPSGHVCWRPSLIHWSSFYVIRNQFPFIVLYLWLSMGSWDESLLLRLFGQFTVAF